MILSTRVIKWDDKNILALIYLTTLLLFCVILGGIFLFVPYLFAVISCPS